MPILTTSTQVGKKIGVCAAVCLLISAAVGPTFSAQVNADHDFYDYPIDFGDINRSNASEKLEPFLARARNADNEAEKGRILSTIAIELGSTYPFELPDSIIEISNLALECDLSVRDRVLVGGMKGTAIRFKHSKSTGDDLRKWRLEASKSFLAGASDAVNSHQEFQRKNQDFDPNNVNFIPRFGNFAPDAQYLSNQEKLQEYYAIEENVRIAKGLTGNVVDMYARPPYDFDELNKLLSENIDDKQLVDEIISKTRESISHRTKRAMEREIKDLADSVSLEVLKPSESLQATALSPISSQTLSLKTERNIAQSPAEKEYEDVIWPYILGVCFLTVGVCLVVFRLRKRK